MKPFITSVILFFNKPSLTKRCIESVFAALDEAKISREKHKLVLVDNGSSDASLEAVIQGIGRSFELVRLTPNRGFACGMNAGLLKAFEDSRTQFANLLCNDVELPLSFFRNVENLSAYAEESAIICPHVYYLSDKSKPSYTHGRLSLPDWELSHHFDSQHRTICFPDYYPAAATLWTRKAFSATNGFNEKYYCYWEDVELSYRCSKAGVSLISMPDLTIHHLGRGTTGGKSSYYEHFLRGRQLTMEIVGG